MAIPPGINRLVPAGSNAFAGKATHGDKIAAPRRQSPDTVLVKPRQQVVGKRVVVADLAAHHQKLGVKVKRTFSRIGNLQVVKLPLGLTVEQAIKQYQASGLVEYAEPDYELRAVVSPNDPRYLDGSLWNLNNTGQNGGTPHADISAPAGWDARTSADPIIVAVIDTGVWYPHEDLASNMWVNPCVNCPVDGVVYPNDVHGINAITGTGDPLDDMFHGTHCAGIIGAVGNNGTGVVGVAWNVRIMACKFLDANGSGFTSDAIECINYAVSKGAKVLSNSWGGSGYDPALHDAIAAARAADVIFVAAAGNSSANNDSGSFYPANYDADLDNVVAVAATDRNDQLASFSDYGATSVQLGAPGVNILSTLPGIQTGAMQSYGLNANYGVLSGTSMACPHVAGAIALVRAQYSNESCSQIIQRVLSNTDPIPSLSGRTLTGGRLNLFNALTQPPQAPFWITYQWRKNGVNLPGRNGSSCSFGPVTTNDNGSHFDVVISNPCGTVISTAAVLTVDTPIQITNQPPSVTQCASNPAILQVYTTGSASINYRWRKVGGGWGKPWVLNSSGPGSGSLLIGSSTNNGDQTYNPSFPTDLDDSGVAFGINASGGHTMQVTRSLIEPLEAGGTFKISMDNGYVAADGAAGLTLYSGSNQLWFEFFCTNNTYYWATKTLSQQSACVPFTSHDIVFYFDMFPGGLLLVVIQDSADPETGLIFEDYLPDLANDPPNHFVLYNRNAGSGPTHDIYFNDFASYEDYGSSGPIGYDNAAETAYTNGWHNGDDGGTGLIAGATNSAYVIPSCALTDAGVYDVIMKNSCGFLASADIPLTVLSPPCVPVPVTPPAAPSGLTVTVVAINQSALSWTDNSVNEDGFKIERSTDGIHFSQIAQVLFNTTAYRDRGLWPGTTYYYRVRAYNYLGESDNSNVATVTTPIQGATSVVAWGGNGYGQTNVPQALTNAAAIAAGASHTLALKLDGTVVAWGKNWYGQTDVPVGLTNVIAVAAGGDHSLALKRDGTVVAWGSSIVGESTVPAGLTNVVAIAGGLYHSLAVKGNGTVVVWGNNGNGEANVPPGLTNAVAVAGGAYHSVALKGDGTVVAWGFNNDGETSVPPSLNNAVAIATTSTGGYNLALRADGTVVAWATQTSVPPTLTNVGAISAGGSHSLALKADGTVFAWGDNSSGQTNVPPGLSDVLAIAAGADYSLALQPLAPLPSPPSALVATAVSAHQIGLVWTDNSTNEIGFAIERARDNGGIPGAWTQMATVASNSTFYNDTGLSSNTKYWYRVRAYNARGDSGYSSPASAVTFDGPTIVLQPSSRTNNAGTTATFTVSASGTPPLSYQWQRNGSTLNDSGNVSGSITPTLTLTNVQDADAAGYTVVVTNLTGNDTSSPPAALTVIDPPVITLQPASCTNNAGTTATFTVTASGTTPSYRWRKSGVNLTDGGNVSGSSTARLTLTNVQYADAVGYTVVITNTAGSVTSSPPANLTVISPPMISTQPSSRTNNAGSTAVFTVSAGGTIPLSYQWQKGGVNLTNTGNVSGATTLALTLTNVQDADVAGYAVVITNVAGSVTSSPPATLSVIDPPVITIQPASRTNDAGTTATFTVTASGTTPSYRWRKGGVNLTDGGNVSGSITATLTLTNVHYADAVDYTVVITNAAGSVTSSPPAILTVIDPPTIAAQPSSRTNNAGTTATFTVSANGAPPFSYQWRRAGSNLTDSGNVSGAISATLTLTNVLKADEGSYSVTITNVFGSTASSGATLTVLDPAINVQPAGSTNNAGTTVTFTVSAGGTAPLGYQWQRNGSTLYDGGNVSGSIAPTLTLTNVQDADAATYIVVITNIVGSITSSPAILTVLDPPVITTQPASRTNTAGSTATFTVSVSGKSPLRGQWLKDGVALINGGNVSGSKAATLTLTNVLKADEGSYSVVISNPDGSTVSSDATLTVIDPVINAQPASRTNNAGSTATFTVSAVGTIPLSYQWQKGGVNLANTSNVSGATTTTLILTKVQDADADTYMVVITNIGGSVTSSPAILTLLDPPVITTQPASRTNAAGTTATFTVSAGGTVPFSYQWQKSGVDLANTGNVSGADSATLTLINLLKADEGSYSVAITSVFGSTVSGDATLTVKDPAITKQPVSRTNNTGTTATFSVNATGSPQLSYRWRKNGSKLTDGGKISGALTPTLTLTNSQSGDAATYTVVITNVYGGVTSSPAIFKVVTVPPSVTVQPLSCTNDAGTAATFAVVVSGSTPFGYQWQKDGVNVTNGDSASGVNTATLTLANVLKADEGSYGVVVTNTVGLATSSNAALTVIDPVITVQPRDQAVLVGSNVTFTVVAAGTALKYQWLVNTVSRADATNATLALGNLSLSDDGAVYSVMVSNAFESVVSSNATLSVGVPPSITVQPQGRPVPAGNNITLTVVAAGTPAPAYQWFLNSGSIGGAVGASLTITNFQSSDEGDYSVRAVNCVGSVMSATAELYLNSHLRFANSLVNGDGLFQSRLSGWAGSNFVIQTSTDLSNWTSLTTNNAPSGIMDFTNTIDLSVTNRWYRAWLVP